MNDRNCLTCRFAREVTHDANGRTEYLECRYFDAGKMPAYWETTALMLVGYETRDGHPCAPVVWLARGGAVLNCPTFEGGKNNIYTGRKG